MNGFQRYLKMPDSSKNLKKGNLLEFRFNNILKTTNLLLSVWVIMH